MDAFIGRSFFTRTFSNNNHGRGRRNNNHYSFSTGQGRRAPHCQLCRTNGHYASVCPKLPTCARQVHVVNPAHAFHSGCHITNNPHVWCVDSGATTHMTPSSSILDSHTPYTGTDKVTIGDGTNLAITHHGFTTLSNDIKLLDVLVVPFITKNLLSVSKLTNDNPVDILFSNESFLIQNRNTKAVLATGRKQHELYVLERGQKAFISNLYTRNLHGSYQLWHRRLGHFNFDVISLLNKLGNLTVTSILPTPRLCSTCQLSKMPVADLASLAFSNYDDTQVSFPVSSHPTDIPSSRPLSSSRASAYDFSTSTKLSDVPLSSGSNDDDKCNAPPSASFELSSSPKCKLCDEAHSDINCDTPPPTEPVPPSPQPATSMPTRCAITSTHPMVTRAKSGIFKPRHIVDIAQLTHTPLHHALLAAKQPRGFKSASKDPAWLSAMRDEMEALSRNHTWELVPRPKQSNVVGSKWVFHTKYNSDGFVDRLKARLVAQGFTQLPGIDYSETFSPMVKSSTVRIVLSLATLNKWPLHQLDVKNAFLNGYLTENVLMEQPRVSLIHVFHLIKFLIQQGFSCSQADPSLFVYKKGSCLLYLLVYVDDIILTGNNRDLIIKFISRLNVEFAIKDLGRLSYFLGLEVTYTDSGLFLSQTKYAHDILTRAKMLESKPIATPLETFEVITSTGVPFNDHTLYRSLVGALQYLTITRPDISYAVNQVSQFLQAPTIAHFNVVKRILRYV
ncbi:uncharacterized protein [Rutidosis leptorrhynchoides]|uniref:uncharacterized protein n=1 Tax=Rutidosis leptorrhynchoides TaxID=125765 RepID=UPI003A994565